MNYSIKIYLNITLDDILIVSIGGNDIALSPTITTIFHMFLMMYLNTIETIQKGPDVAWGMYYFVDSMEFRIIF